MQRYLRTPGLHDLSGENAARWEQQQADAVGMNTLHENGSPMPGSLESNVRDWLATDRQRSLLLLGEFGDLITPRTSVLVVGDARSNGFDARTDLVAEIGRRAHRLAWVTPEPSRYWSQTGCAMADYAEHCSGVVSVRDGAEMLARCDELGAALR